MATAVRETIIANPARRRRKKKRNMARRRNRNMSAKQIRIFGTPRQKAALKAKHRRKKTNSSHRPRTKARRTVKRSNPVHHRIKRRRRTQKARRQRNLGAIYALTANPAKRRKNVARHRRRKSSNPRHHRRAGSSRHHRMNPARRRHHYRRNPGQFGNPIDWLWGGTGVIVGVVGTRALPQLVLGSSNTGVMGYLANAASTALLTFAAHLAAPQNTVLKASVLAGGAASILSRVIQDYTLLGSYSSSVGLGDYLVSNFFTPQTLANGLQNAQLNYPGPAMAPSVPANVQGAGVGMGDIYGGALY